MGMYPLDIWTAMQESAIATNEFHWLKWHVCSGEAVPVPFAWALCEALAKIDRVMPGYAQRTVDALASLPDRERDLNDYDQIVQRLAEVVVVRRLVDWGIPLGAKFVDEPSGPGSNKNPEVGVQVGDGRLFVEVKTPALRDHAALRGSQGFQIPARVLPVDALQQLEKGLGPVTKPRDNPVKDFLRSAEAKFAPLKVADPGVCCVLVIVWDDFAFEALASLIHKEIGLLTPNSWLRANGEVEVFPSIDAVVVTGHQLVLQRALADVPPFQMGQRGLDWAHGPDWFGVIAIDNPAGGGLVSPWFGAIAPRPLGPDEGQTDTVMWVGGDVGKSGA